MGTESFPGVKCGRGVLLTTHPLLVPRSRKSRDIPLPTLWATEACNRDYFTLRSLISFHHCHFYEFCLKVKFHQAPYHQQIPWFVNKANIRCWRRVLQLDPNVKLFSCDLHVPQFPRKMSNLCQLAYFISKWDKLNCGEELTSAYRLEDWFLWGF